MKIAKGDHLGVVQGARWKFWVPPPWKKSPPLEFELFQIQVIMGWQIEDYELTIFQRGNIPTSFQQGGGGP